MASWFDLWKRWTDIAVGAPQVVSHRLGMLHGAPLAPATIVEANTMVFEKMAAANEVWWSLWSDSMRVRWPVLPSAASRNLWWGPLDAISPHHAVRAAHRALAPVSRRVKANNARLGRAARR